MRAVIFLGFFVVVSISAIDPDPSSDKLPEWREICSLLDQLERVNPEFRASLLHILSARTPSGHNPLQCEAGPSSTPSPEVGHANELWKLMNDIIFTLTHYKFELEILQQQAAVASELKRTVLQAPECAAGPSSSTYDRSVVEQLTNNRIQFLSESIERMQVSFQDLFIQLINYKTYPVEETQGVESNDIPEVVLDAANRPAEDVFMRDFRRASDDITHQATVIQQVMDLVYENLAVLNAIFT